MRLIFYVSSPASAGKTYLMRQAAYAEAAAGKWVLLVLPTLALIEEVLLAFRELASAIEPQVINSETTSFVISTLLAALRKRPAGGQIIIITWSAFAALPFFPGKELWTVFIDEVPQVWNSVELIVPKTHRYLTDHLELRPQGPVYGRLIVTSSSRLNRLAHTDDRALAHSLAPIARTIRSPNIKTYTRSASYEALLTGKQRKLSLHFLLRPRMLDGFKKVTILAANFEHSLLVKIWSVDGVIFAEDKELAGQLRYRQHPNGHLIRIYHGVGVSWSKRSRDRNDREVFTALVNAFAKLMAGEPFAWAANKDVPDTLFDGHPGTRLPHVSHGLNRFDSFHNIVDLSARLPTPEQFAFLAWIGVLAADVRRAVHLDAVYQTVLRSSIRNPSDGNPKRAVVPDLPSAKHLQALLPGSSIVKIDIGVTESSMLKRPGRIRKHDNTAARVRAHRAEKVSQAARLAAIMMDEFGEFTTILPKVALPEEKGAFQKTCNEITYIKDGKNIVTQNYQGSIFDHMKATHPCAVVTDVGNEEFIAALKKAHKEKHSEKEDNRLISPALFDESLSENTSRGLANVVCANGIWLDVDAGEMTQKDFAGIFPHLRIVAFNSFSSTKQQPRYRIYIPTSRTMSTVEYASILDQIIQTVKDAGFPQAKSDENHPDRMTHGIDMTKRHAASLFYLPCQPRDPKGRIWKDFKGDARKPLDVDDWLEHAIPIEVKEYDIVTVPEQLTDRDVDHARSDQALRRWDDVGKQKGHGDTEMYRLARELERARVPFSEAESTLLTAAKTATSPGDRTRQAKAILRNRRKFWPP